MGLRTCAAGAVAAALTVAAVTSGAASASAAEPAFTIDACTVAPLGSIVYLVPVGTTVRFDTSVCTFHKEWTESNPFDVNIINPGEYYDATIATSASFVEVRDPSAEFVLYPCEASTQDGSRLAAWNSSEFPTDPGFAGYWDPIFAVAIDMGCASQGEPPASWHLSYARTSDAACEAGWSASWAAWPNNGNGGPVCNREIFFDVATGAWSSR